MAGLELAWGACAGRGAARGSSLSELAPPPAFWASLDPHLSSVVFSAEKQASSAWQMNAGSISLKWH